MTRPDRRWRATFAGSRAARSRRCWSWCSHASRPSRRRGSAARSTRRRCARSTRWSSTAGRRHPRRQRRGKVADRGPRAHARAAVPGTRGFVGARDGFDACNVTLYCDGAHRAGRGRQHAARAPRARPRPRDPSAPRSTREASGADCVRIPARRRGRAAVRSTRGSASVGRPSYWAFTRPAVRPPAHRRSRRPRT